MEIRMGAEVGLKKAASLGMPEVKKKIENFANLPGRDMNNRQARNIERTAGALRPTELKDRYKVLGNTIDMQA